MANRWGIPKDVEDIVIKRDTKCVYCGVVFSSKINSRKDKPSWEHIINDIHINGPENIALCCMSCNASKGSKLLKDWLLSDYCRKKGITADSVDEVVKRVLKHTAGING